MARKSRIHYPGALYHVMLRGNGGMEIFTDDQDRYRFFLFLQEGIERFGYRVYAYCLMDNHIHLALQIGEIPLSRAMQNLSFRFARWINWRTQRTGHLFQGRYKAVLVETDEYLLQLVAYLHLNPVRAGMVEEPLEYCWSSHRAYLGKEQIPWLSSTPVLARLAKKVVTARKCFADFVASQIPLGHRKEFHGRESKDSRIVGEDSFLDEVLRQTEEEPLVRPDLATCIRLVANYFDCDAEALRQAGRRRPEALLRAFLAWSVLEFSSSSLTELAHWLDRDLSSLSSAIRRLEARRKEEPAIEQDMERVRALMSKESFATSQA